MKRNSSISCKVLYLWVSLSMLFTVTSNVYAKDSPTSERPMNLNYSWFGSTTEPHTDVVKYLISEIDKRTKGRVKITYHPSASLLSGPQSYDGVMKGISDMDFVVMAYTPSRFPLTFAWNLPLGIKSSTAATRIYNESYKKFNPKELSGVKILYIYGSPPCHLQTIKPLNTMADFKGMKIRCTGIGAEFVKQLGGTPVSMPMGQVFEALQKGIVEGTINSQNVLRDYKFAELVKYQYDWSTYTVAFIAIMNKDKWESMPPDIQKVFEEIAPECLSKDIELWDAAEDRARNFGLEHGMKFFQPTSEMTQALSLARQPLYDDYVKNTKEKGLPGKEFLDELIRLTNKYK